jgi:hypothetical protein
MSRIGTKSLSKLVFTVLILFPVGAAAQPGYNFRGITASIEEFEAWAHLKGNFSTQVDFQMVTQSAYTDQNANPFAYVQRLHIRPWLIYSRVNNTQLAFSTSYIKKWAVPPVGLPETQEIRVHFMGTFTQPRSYGSIYEQVRFEVRNVLNEGSSDWKSWPRFRFRFGLNFNLAESKRRPRLSVYQELMLKIKENEKAYDIGRVYIGYGFNPTPKTSLSVGLIAQAALRGNGRDMDVYYGPSMALKYTFGKPKGAPLPPDPDVD